MKLESFLIGIIILVAGCSSPQPGPEEIVNKSINTHGGDILDTSAIAFTFRNKDYSLDRKGSNFIYTRSFPDSTGVVIDSLINSTDFTRYINGQRIELNEEWSGKYANSVNSVLYFTQIPYVLSDPAVNLRYQGVQNIDGEPYHSIEVYFDQQGGGEDFDDEYRYWIHTENYTVDFLAYNYHTEEGGTRFRKAIDRQKIDGMIFQNYINYAPSDKFPPLDSLPVYYGRNELKELSRIINENVTVID